MKFRATLQLDGKTATGITVPFGGYGYETTIGRLRGEFKIPVSAAVRERAGVAAGDVLDVEIELAEARR
jgi:hypothetical protein